MQSSTGQNSFFGGVCRLPSFDDLVAGFVIYTPDNENINQEFNLGDASELKLRHAYAKQKFVHSTIHVKGAIAKHLTQRLGVGASIGYVRHTDIQWDLIYCFGTLDLPFCRKNMIE